MSASTLLELLPDEVRYTRQELPEDQNAYELWVEAFEHFCDADDDDQVYSDFFWGTDDEDEPTKPPTEAGYDHLRALVESNRKAFDLIDAGTARGRLQLPLIDDSFDASFDSITSIRAISRMRCVGAKLLFVEQQFEEMATELLSVLHIGELLCKSDGTVVDQMVGHAVIRSALCWIQEFASESKFSVALRTQLLTEFQQCQPSLDGLVQAYISDLCCCSIPMLEKVPENTDLKTLVEHLSEHWYNNTTMSDIYAEMGEEFADEPISPEVREERLGLRKRQLFLLLHGHPKPFDKEATARLVGKDTAEYIHSIEGNGDSPETVDPLAGVWPEMLAPRYPLDSFGFDLQAIAEREELLESLGPEDRAQFEHQLQQPTDAQIVALNPKLRRIDNPVGLLLREQLRPTDLRSFLSDHEQQRQATMKQLRTLGQKLKSLFSRLKTPRKRT